MSRAGLGRHRSGSDRRASTRFGGRRPVRFGGDRAQSADSDVDLAVLAGDAKPLPLRKIGELGLDFSTQLGRTADVVDLALADGILRFEILSQGQVLLSEPLEAWTEVAACTLIDHDDVAMFLPSLVAGVGRAARGER